MGKLGYNPKIRSKKKGEVPPGVYQFRVFDIQEREFGTGTEGMTITFDVFADNRVIKAYENMYYTDDAQWKLERFFEAIGLVWKEEEPYDKEEILNKTGTAYFTRAKDEKYLGVKEFLMPKSGPVQNSGKVIPPSMPDEDVPF
jgi:hypothetical protein